MTTTAVVVGCDQVDADSSWVRLHVAGGHLKTIDWNGITMAALVQNDQHMTFKGDLEQITALRSSHDPLWIESVDGLAIAMLEKAHPKRDVILEAFQQHLGDRWHGDRLTPQGAAMRLFKAATPARAGSRKLVLVMIVVAVFMFFLALVISIIKH